MVRKFEKMKDSTGVCFLNDVALSSKKETLFHLLTTDSYPLITVLER